MEQMFLSLQTDEDFSKARNKAFFNEIQHLLNPEEAKLISFTDIKKMLKPSNEVYKGMQVVPIKLIVGSEGRYKDFDNHFLPKNNFLKSRWEHVDMAHYQDITLPPVSLYELGGLYFVRDGNHRVSVAKMKGIENMEKANSEKSFMEKIASLIVDKRNIVLLLYAAAIIFSLFSQSWVKVCNDITEYLPADTETRQGLSLMEDEFVTFSTSRVMVANITHLVH